MAVNFNIPTFDQNLIDQIVDRMLQILESGGVAFTKRARTGRRMEIVMDLTACHANGNPLRLADLLAADDFNVAHDVGGISRHLDRTTGKLTQCFRPRFSA
jgi:hypothetical protein